MAFDFNAWQRAAWEQLKGWKTRLTPGIVNAGYVGVTAGVLWPLVHEAKTGDTDALVDLTKELGVNIIAEQILRWKVEANDESDVATWIQEHLETNTALRLELERVVEKLQALELAKSALPEADQEWFEGTLHSELARLGSLPRLEARVTGNYNVVAVGEGASASLTIQEHHHHYPLDPRAMAADGEAAARRNYLDRFARWCNVLPLAALGDEESAFDELTLDRVYIGLHTESHVQLATAEQERSSRRSKKAVSRPLTAQEAAGQSRRLVLLGEPGAGKSAFVRSWLRQLALAGIGKAEPPLGLRADLLPVFLTLRDLAPRLAPLDFQEPLTELNRRQLIQTVFAQLDVDVRETVRTPDFAEGLRRAVDAGAVVLVLDGLDEVPPHLRRNVRWAVNAILSECTIQHVVITCRVRSYGGSAVFPGFHTETLAPFTPDHIRNFAKNWYKAQSARFDAAQVAERGQDLEVSALDNELFSLSQNPMLLTCIAILHQENIDLPPHRVRILSQLVEVLLRRWQKHKTNALEDFLQDEGRVRRTVERLAFEAHAHSNDGRANSEEANDLTRGEALALLEGREYLQTATRAAAFLEYIDQRAGLLVGRGGEPGRPAMYTFPHRTFQEYLAGCHITQGDLPHREHYRFAGQGDYWSMAAQFGAEDLLYNRHKQEHLQNLAYQLLRERGGTLQDRRAALWSGKYAALVGEAVVAADSRDPQGGSDYLARIRPTLEGLLASELSPNERSEAGRSLALLGDHRNEAVTVEGMLFSFVPRGPFHMGSDGVNDVEAMENERPVHYINLADFWISVHPVSNAQLAAFAADGGYREAAFWPEAISAGVWREGLWEGVFKRPKFRDRPAQSHPTFGFNNQPAMNVTWYEALAFTRWLNRLHGPQLPQGYTFGLPSEAEWEKTARGGLRIPVRPTHRAMNQGFGTVPIVDLEMNPLPDRRFPWGDDFDQDCANTSGARLGSTSALGVFSKGSSPYGCFDLSGNVWEWTRNQGGCTYPFSADDRCEDLDARSMRVLRGGSFLSEAGYARCTVRAWDYPSSRSVYCGFRVVASPHLPAVQMRMSLVEWLQYGRTDDFGIASRIEQEQRMATTTFLGC